MPRATRYHSAQVEPRDREILSTLTHKVRLLTLDQVARTWWGTTRDPRANARRRLALLVVSGFIERVQVNARPELELERPLLTWTLTDPPPHFGKTAYRLQSRWKEPPQRTTLYIATRKAAKEFGGVGGRHLKPLQASHDLHVSTVYLHYRTTRPDEAAAWISEDKLAPFRRHQKLPDAVLGENATSLLLAVEFGGGYDADRLAAFHADCARRALPYEVW